MTDYERGVEQASAIYKEVIRDYVAENAKLRELVAHYERAVTVHDVKPVEVLEWSVRCDALRKELGIEVDA